MVHTNNAQDTPISQHTNTAPALPEEYCNTDSRRDGEPQETPRVQQRAVMPTEGDKTINGDIPCEEHTPPTGTSKERTTNVDTKLQDTEHTMHSIDALLKEAKAPKGPTQQRELTERIGTLISETKTSLLTLEATQGKTQELSILWTSLIRTHFGNNMF